MTIQKREEAVRIAILKTAQAPGRTDFAGFLPGEYASRFDLPENHVREIAESLDREGLIVLSVSDGEREHLFSELTPDAFWKNQGESGYRRIRITLAGRQVLESAAPKRPIGFHG